MNELPEYVQQLMDKYPIGVEEARLLILLAYRGYGTTVVKEKDALAYVWARDKIRDNPTQEI